MNRFYNLTYGVYRVFFVLKEGQLQHKVYIKVKFFIKVVKCGDAERVASFEHIRHRSGHREALSINFENHV